MFLTMLKISVVVGALYLVCLGFVMLVNNWLDNKAEVAPKTPPDLPDPAAKASSKPVGPQG